nr:hypothetical protein [Tanacetum cinerariifolium]
FLIHLDEALEIKKFKRARENKIEFAYDYGNRNASYQTSSLKPYVPTVILEKIIIDLEDEVVSLLEKQKANLKTIESLKSKGFESSEDAISESENQSENDCHVGEKECHKVVNSKVTATGMFKLSVSQSVSLIFLTKTSCDYKNVENKKRRKIKSSKQNDKQVNNDVSRANSDFIHFSDLDTFSSVKRPKQSSVIWKKKGSSNTSNVDLSSVSHLKLKKDVKRYSRKDLLSCNNSHLEETGSACDCNDAMNVSCNSRLYDSFDENNLFIFDNESIRISPVSKMPFKKKPHDSMNVCSKSNSNKSLPRTVHRWLPKMQPLAEPVAKWISKIVHICLWIIDSGCSKHMTGNRALLTNFVEKFLGTVHFGNNDFAVIAGYGDVGLEVAFRKSTCFVRNEDGVDFLTGDRSLNLYTLALNEVASNSLTCLLANASSSQSWLWHQRIGFENPRYFEKAKDLRPTLYDEKVIGLGYTLMFLTHSDEALEIEKFKRSRENKIEFAYDYGNLNANLEDEVVNLLEKEKVNLETIESLIKSFESSEKVSSESENQSENDCLVVEKECDKEENPKHQFQYLDTFSSVRRPQNSGVIWKKKRSFNTSNIGLSAVSVSNLNKNVKRYSRKDLLACNNSHLGETSCASVCDDAMNVFCNRRMCNLLDDNNFVIFDDVNVRISPVSKMPFRKKPIDSMQIVQIYLWIIDSGCSKHMTGNHALLTNFVENFLGTVRFGNNDFAVIAGYGDVVIGPMTIKKVYYVKGLGHNLFSVGQFCDKGLEVAF